MRKFYWSELTTAEFSRLEPEATIAILPLAATEQHGPHLPLSTDTTIAEGMLAEVTSRLPDDLSILILPTQAVGKSNEHIRSPGTLTLSSETAARAWIELGQCVQRAGLRKLVLLNSHGGNVELIGLVARDLRVDLQMLVVACNWGDFDEPPGVYDPIEADTGIHGGDLETSLMLHFRPDLVRMEAAQDFTPATRQMRREFAWLKPTGRPSFGWIAQDLHPSGAVGDAAQATAEKGRLTAEYRAARFIELLRDIRSFALTRLA